MIEASASSEWRHSPQAMLRNLSLARKVALIPALTMVLMGVMLFLAVQMGERQTAAMHTLDHDVFEPLSRAQTLKDETTLLHTRLFALLSLGTNEANPSAQKADADMLLAQLDAAGTNIGRFLDTTGGVPPAMTARLREEFNTYADSLRQTAGFAAYDASYGALLAGTTNDHFTALHADLDALVQALAQRRAALTTEAIGNSVDARRRLLGLGVGAALVSLLGSMAVGRSIAWPVLRLTALLNRLAGGEIDLAVSGTDQRDEVGAMAHAIEVFRATLIARRQAEVALRGLNLQLDAALNSMLQGMIVWGPDHRVRLVNRRFFALCGMPLDSIAPGMTVSEVIDAAMRHGLHPDADPQDLRTMISTRLHNQRSSQYEIAMRPGLFVRIASEPMADGGAVVTYEDVTQKRRSEEQITVMARHDALTGLANRTMFQEHLDAAVARLSKPLEVCAQTHPEQTSAALTSEDPFVAQAAPKGPFGSLGDGQQFAVLCLDLDHFKEVNDTLGHAAGDDLLRQVADRLRDCVRGHDLIARLGGDEFAVVMASAVPGPAHATSLAARLVEVISAPYEVQGNNVIIGISVGIAIAEPGVAGTEHLKRADVALYRAKEERGTFVFFETGMDQHLHARRGLEADLRAEIQRDEFELNYQPLYNLAQDSVTGFEALIRWNSPTRGRVSPADFISLAEQTGLIIPIGEWVLRTACAEAASWPDHISVAVNLSPAQFKSKRLFDMVNETLQACGLPPRRLELEITETMLLQQTDTVMATLRGLHDLGVRVSIDDFGTGYSSLSYLGSFPFDKIKIDRSFISDFHAAPGGGDATGTGSAAADSAATIVRAIIGLGKNLGISTIAEGVETAEQFAQLRQQGCSEVQGYFLSKPRPAAEVMAMIQRLDATLPAIGVNRGDRAPLTAKYQIPQIVTYSR